MKYPIPPRGTEGPAQSLADIFTKAKAAVMAAAAARDIDIYICNHINRLPISPGTVQAERLILRRLGRDSAGCELTYTSWCREQGTVLYWQEAIQGRLQWLDDLIDEFTPKE